MKGCKSQDLFLRGLKGDKVRDKKYTGIGAYKRFDLFHHILIGFNNGVSYFQRTMDKMVEV